MKILSHGYLLVFYLLAVSVSIHAAVPSHQEGHPAVDNHGPTSIPIGLDPYGHIIVDARVDGVQGRFILDTGAGINVFTKAFADKLGSIRKEDGYFTGFRATGEALKVRLYQVNEIRIGNMKTVDPVVTVLDADLGHTDGLISLTCFRRRAFTIDFAAKKLWLETKSSLASRVREGRTVPIQLDDQRGISLDMFTSVRVDNRLTLEVSLDSGAGFDVYRFNSGFMKDIGIDTAMATKVFKTSTFNNSLTNVFYVDTVNDISLSAAPSVRALDVKTSFLPGLIYDGITCINWLGKQITVDIPDRKMIVN